MAGFNLGEGILKEASINEEFFDELLECIFSSKKRNSYKFFLFITIIKISLNGLNRLTLKEVTNKFIEIYWEYFTEKNTSYPDELRDSKLLQIIESKDYKKMDNLSNDELKIIKKDIEIFLKKYMFGALYVDTKGSLFGFSKLKNEFYINKELISYLESDVLPNKYINLIKQEVELFLTRSAKNTGGKKMIYYQQKFGFEINYIDLFVESKDLLKKTKLDLSMELGIGIPKLDAIFQYLEISDVIQNKEITLFGKKIKDMKSNDDFIEPIVYYNMVKNPEIGGHYIYSNLINGVIYDYLILNNELELEINIILKNSEKYKPDSIISKDWERMNKQALSSLADTQSGFGKMGIIEKADSNSKDDIYEAHSYWVEPLVGAYILYDIWEDGRASMGIDNIAHDKYNLGRMFLMDKDAVEEILEEIKALGLITIEKGAGLNQVRIIDKYTKEDILDMMVKEA